MSGESDAVILCHGPSVLKPGDLTWSNGFQYFPATVVPDTTAVDRVAQ